MIPSEETRSGFSISEEDAVVADGLSLDSDAKNAGGAPVESESPMGSQVGWWTIVFLNLSGTIGTGIFSTPGNILKQTGSIGVALIYWVIGFAWTYASFAYYTELAAIFPNRAGAEVVYFEQIYKRPKFFFPATFAAVTVLLGYSSTNCIVFAQYVLYSRGITEPGTWQLRGIAVGIYAIVCGFAAVSTKWSLRASNLLGMIKLLILSFIVVAGWVVLAGGTRIENPRSHFSNGFAGSLSNGNNHANALINIHFAYSGWATSNNLMNEIGGNRVKRLKIAGTTSLLLLFFLYFFANIAYIAAVPPEEAKKSGQLIAAVFFTKVFGDYAGTRILPILIALSAVGNLLTTAIGQARVIREVARQGVLPFSSFLSSTKPFGTPLGPLLVKFTLTAIVTVAPPAGDAFNFLVSLGSYPHRIFDVLLIVGVWILRRRMKREAAPEPAYRAWNVALIFSLVAALFVLIMPWVPPAGGRYGGNVSFWYGTATVAGIGILVLCFFYWFVWSHVWPKTFGYAIVEEVVQGERGELSKVFVRVYNDHRGDAYRDRIANKNSPVERRKPFRGTP